MEERFLTPEDIAKRLHLKPYTIKKYLRSGEIRGIKIGNRWRIKESDFQEYIDSRKIEFKSGS